VGCGRSIAPGGHAHDAFATLARTLRRRRPAVRNPCPPLEAALYIPATTERTAERCVTTDGARSCKVATQTNNVEADERGLVYLADRANSGLHIVSLTGEASRIAGGNGRRPDRAA